MGMCLCAYCPVHAVVATAIAGSFTSAPCVVQTAQLSAQGALAANPPQIISEELTCEMRSGDRIPFLPLHAMPCRRVHVCCIHPIVSMRIMPDLFAEACVTWHLKKHRTKPVLHMRRSLERGHGSAGQAGQECAGRQCLAATTL